MRQAEALARVRAARAQRDRVVEEAAERLRLAILDAYRAGAAINDIAAAAGMSRQWIWTVTHDAD